jgi:hypothetical protein
MNIKITKLNLLLGTLLFSFALVNTTFAQAPNFKTNTLTQVAADFMPAQVDLSNPLPSKVYRDGEVTVIEMAQEFLFPASIDATGKKVVIQKFGSSEDTHFWSLETGLTTFPGLGVQVKSDGIIAGDFMYDGFPGGVSATTGGTFDVATDEWTFLGMNPDYPEINPDGYNSVWGMSDDGATLVGMQLGADWSATAFKWTSDGGYNNIGASLENSSRASGVSRNGEVVYGWTTDDIGYWMPIAWHNDTYTILITGEDGEAMCASPEGTYVAGHSENSAFLWSEAGGLVTFGTYEDFPTIAMEDGGVFGFTGVFPPDARRAFYKDPIGNITTFNDYAEARGMLNAQAWTFYSVNDVTPDGDKFIGIAMNPDGVDVCFLMDFSTFVNTNTLPETAVNVYPNPTTDNVTVENLAGNAIIRIMDLQGRLIYEQQPVGGSTTIEMGKFNKGVYLMIIENNGKLTHKKIDLI